CRSKEKGRANTPGPVVPKQRLEFQSQTELNPASRVASVRRSERRSDHPERRQRLIIQSRCREVRMIEDVEEIERKPHMEPLRNRRVLLQACVEIPESQSAERIRSAAARIRA